MTCFNPLINYSYLRTLGSPDVPLVTSVLGQYLAGCRWRDG
jgi:hypothetical protein